MPLPASLLRSTCINPTHQITTHLLDHLRRVQTFAPKETEAGSLLVVRFGGSL